MKSTPGQQVQKCVNYDDAMQGLDDEDCALEKCSLCNFHGEVFFKLKGICDTSTLIDTDYSMIFDSSTLENFHFQGFSGRTFIVSSNSEKGWIIKDNLKNKGRIFGIFNKTTVPIGLHSWSMFTTCEIINEELQNVQLKLTKVF